MIGGRRRPPIGVGLLLVGRARAGAGARAGGGRSVATRLVARGALDLGLVDQRDPAGAVVRIGLQLQIRPREHDPLLADTEDAALADDDVGDLAAGVDDQLRDLTDVLVLGVLRETIG